MIWHPQPTPLSVGSHRVPLRRRGLRPSPGPPYGTSGLFPDAVILARYICICMSVTILAQAGRKKIGDGPPFREDHSNTGRGPIFWGGHGHGGIDEAKSTCPTPGVTRRPNPCLLRAEDMSGLGGNREVGGGFQPQYLQKCMWVTLGSLCCQICVYKYMDMYQGESGFGGWRSAVR